MLDWLVTLADDPVLCIKPLGHGNFSLEDFRGLLIGLEFSLGQETDSPSWGPNIGGVYKGSVKTCMVKNF